MAIDCVDGTVPSPDDLEQRIPDPGIRFSPRDAEGPRIAEAEPDIALDLAELNAPTVGKPVTEGVARPLLSVSSWVRPGLTVFQDLEVATSVPFGSWHRHLENARTNVQRALHDPFERLARIYRGMNEADRFTTQALIEMKFQGETEDLKRFWSQAPPRVQKAAELTEQLYREFLTKEIGLEEAEIKELFSEFPAIRRAGGDWKLYASGVRQVPPTVGKLRGYITRGELPLTDRETDAYRIAKRLIRSYATERYMVPSWNNVFKEMSTYNAVEGTPFVQNAFTLFHKYMSEAMYQPDDLAQALTMWVESINRRLLPSLAKVARSFGKEELAVRAEQALVHPLAGDVAGHLLSWNYVANMAWNPGMVMRQYMQTLMTTYPILGEKWTSVGLAKAWHWMRDPKTRQFFEDRGVVNRDWVTEATEEAARTMRETGGSYSNWGVMREWFLEKGSKWYRTGDDFNRVVAYWGQHERAKYYGERYLSGKIGWAEFLEKSKLDMQDARNGAHIGMIKDLMDNGKAETAYHDMASFFQKHTQFVYSRGSNPRVMQGTFGRLWSQYGTWPAWYVDYLHTLAMRGSKANRLKSIARWAGTQTAFMEVGAHVFGVDMSRWTFFSPIAYQGGPFVETAFNASSALAVATGTEDVVDKIRASRFLTSAIQQTVPFPWAAIRSGGKAWDAIDAINGFQNADVAKATKGFLGFPEAR